MLFIILNLFLACKPTPVRIAPYDPSAGNTSPIVSDVSPTADTSETASAPASVKPAAPTASATMAPISGGSTTATGSSVSSPITDTPVSTGTK